MYSSAIDKQMTPQEMAQYIIDKAIRMGGENKTGYDCHKFCQWLVDFFDNLFTMEMNIMKQKPSIGRIVHYQRYGTPGGEHKSEPSAAIITSINDEATQRCQLFVMNPNGVYFNDTPYSETPKPGHWNWPPII